MEIKQLIFTIILLLLSTFPANKVSERGLQHQEEHNHSATILLDKSMYLKRGKAIGFNYELFQKYGAAHKCNITVKPPVPKSNYWDSLMVGTIDIIVADSIPESYEKQFVKSIPTAGKDCWIVRADDKHLLDGINMWITSYSRTNEYKRLKSNYLRSFNIKNYALVDLDVNRLSPYDELIKKYSKFIGWDWRLLTSVVYQESRFSMGAQSSRDALGLMQIKSSTAQYYDINNIYDPEMNIKAGALHLQRLSNIYKRYQFDSLNIIKFTLAAYNAGEGRIDNCIDVAKQHNIPYNQWDSVVTCFQYMPDFRGDETKKYVEEVLKRCDYYCKIIN